MYLFLLIVCRLFRSVRRLFCKKKRKKNKRNTVDIGKNGESSLMSSNVVNFLNALVDDNHFVPSITFIKHALYFLSEIYLRETAPIF